MQISRRALMGGAAAASAAAAFTPERLWAAAASAATPADWSLAVGDVEADIAPRAMRLVHGRAPAALEGALYRTGPAKFRYGSGAPAHWFDGDGLVRSVRVADGRATLAARFVDTPKRRADQAAKALMTPGFGTPGSPTARISGPDDLNAANTHVIPVAGKVWALWESGSPSALNAADLSTYGFVTLREDLKGAPFLAHPKTEPDGRIWNLGVMGRRAVVWRLSASGVLEALTPIDLPRASYIHDFTATDRELVILLQPWVRDHLAVPITAGMAWKPELGTQILVLDKADLSRRRTYELPPFFFFHLGDAWREADGTIRFDGCLGKDAAFATDYVGKLTGGGPITVTPPRAAMFALHPDGRATMEPVETIAEFPRTDPRFAGRRRNLTWHVSGEELDRPLAQSWAMTDWRRGRTEEHRFGAHQMAEEAVFVPRPGSTSEGDGWLVGTTLNLQARATELHVFDARRIAAGPLATWRADVALPVGFHGSFLAA